MSGGNGGSVLATGPFYPLLDLTEQAGIFGEYLGIASSDYQAYASAGVTYAVNENLQLDFGTLIGLNDAAEDFSIYPGVTLRF